MANSTDLLHLAVALDGTGWHPTAWREPDARPAELFTARYWVDVVQEAERGLLDFVTVHHRGFVGNILRVPALFAGRIDRSAGIDTHRVREVTIRSREAMLFHVDGEAMQGSNTLAVRVHPGALRLRA